jgi:Ca-activated chloride channel homolog
MKTLKMISLALAMLISFVSFGQETRTITGTVKDNTGLPLPGVSVLVKGTKTSASTGFDGTYKIQAKTGEILIFNFIGMISKSVVVSNSNVINVTLTEEANHLSEVVVTVGYGKSSEDSDEGESYVRPQKKSKASAVQMLQGRAAGVAISQNNTPIVSNRPVGIRDKKDTMNTTTDTNQEDYGIFVENAFESPKTSPLSTFSIDVDNASYTNVRRVINTGQKVPKDAVRVEEMINFFKYNYPQPTNENPFSINTEFSNCPWNTKHQILKIGLKGKNIPTENLPASNLVFLIDVSGSMGEPNKLPLLKQSLKILVNELRPKDKVAIVVYAGAAGLVLPPTSGIEKQTIINALDNLNAGGSTAGGAGIQLAYKIAMENFIEKGNNRVILATDGDFNVGSSSDSDMQNLIEDKRKSGVFLTCLGYGMGNYKDKKMEILADKGNGNYAYIDNIQEANRFLGKEFKGSMFAIAKDVKIQIEFNPKHVQSYRLIGYENRKLRPEDFKNDAIDAGELGSGHTVTALYEIIPTGVESAFLNPKTDDLKYTKVAENNTKYNDELATIKFRYKKPDENKSIEMVDIIENKTTVLENASEDFKFSSAVAWFGLKLRDSKLVTNKESKDILELANKGITTDIDGYRAEFIRLVETVN